MTIPMQSEPERQLHTIESISRLKAEVREKAVAEFIKEIQKLAKNRFGKTVTTDIQVSIPSELEKTFTLSQVTAIFDELEKCQNFRYDLGIDDKFVLWQDILALRKQTLGAESDLTKEHTL